MKARPSTSRSRTGRWDKRLNSKRPREAGDRESGPGQHRQERQGWRGKGCQGKASEDGTVTLRIRTIDHSSLNDSARVCCCTVDVTGTFHVLTAVSHEQ